MMAELGSARIKRAGPGEDITPNPTAAIKSTIPMIFQIHTIGRAFAPCRCTSHATSGAVAPTKISPQPATGANGAGRRPTAYRTIKDSEKTNRVHANKQPQRRPVETLAQRFYARDRCAKDRDRQCHGEAKTGRAQPMFVIQCAIRRQNYHDHEPSTKPRQLGESVSLHWNRM